MVAQNNSICIEQRRHCVSVKSSVCNVSLLAAAAAAASAGKHELYSFRYFQ